MVSNFHYGILIDDPLSDACPLIYPSVLRGVGQQVQSGAVTCRGLSGCIDPHFALLACRCLPAAHAATAVCLRLVQVGRCPPPNCFWKSPLSLLNQNRGKRLRFVPPSTNTFFVLFYRSNLARRIDRNAQYRFSPSDSDTPLPAQSLRPSVHELRIRAVPPRSTPVLPATCNPKQAFTAQWDHQVEGTGRFCRTRPSLVLAFVLAFGRPFAAAGVFKLVHDLSQFIGAQPSPTLTTYPSFDPNCGCSSLLLLYFPEGCRGHGSAAWYEAWNRK